MSLDNGSENSDVVLMKKKICYSREFLLSLSNLDICKKLPSGLEESLRSEFKDALLGTADRPRFSGNFSLQGFKINDFGSSPPSWADSGSYSRGTYGKWESRSSGWSDRDSDSQSDRDSDSGRRYSYQSRRSWQSPEHDGLLGSGSYPRTSGYSTGTSTPKTWTNEHNQLIRSNEPYHPPRPYKAAPHSRRDTDAYNDETFGSIDSTSMGRAEEERRRRESFEMMRKEQQRSLQEKQKLNLEKHKGGDVPDLCEGLVDGKEEGLLIKSNELMISASAPIPISSNDSEKLPSASQSPALRPVVPPGFKSNSLEKSFELKSQIHSPLTEVESVGKTVAGDAEASIAQNTTGGLVKQQYEEISVFNGQSSDKTKHKLLNHGEIVNVHSSSDVPIEKPFMEDQFNRFSSNVDSLATHNVSGVSELNTEIFEDKTISSNSATSILDKIFGSTLSLKDDQSSLVENLDSKPDDSWLPSSAQSSKFAQWFFEEEAKLPDDTSSAGPNNLLSWIASGDNANRDSKVCASKKDEAFPAVLTCEDLEQSILSEYSSSTAKVEPLLGSGNVAGANSELPSAPVDDHASLHLLSMLQKSTHHGDMAINSGGDVNFIDKWIVPGERDMVTAVNEPEELGNSKISPNSGQTLTLETLFGTAFMKELQSVEAPVSVKRGSIDNARVGTSESHGLAFPMTESGFSFLVTDKNQVQRLNNDYSTPSNNRPKVKLSETDKWVGIGDFPIRTTSSQKLHTLAVPKDGGPEKIAEFQLTKEDNFIALHDAKDYMLAGNSINDTHIPSSRPINIAEKLAALVSVEDSWVMEGSGGLPLARDSYRQMGPEIPYQNLQMQQQSSLFHPPQMTQLNPLYPQLESHHPTQFDSQMNILSPENICNHDSLANHQFSSGIVRPLLHPNARVAGFDVASQHSVHQMQMPGNCPPHMLRDFPRGTHAPHHVNQTTGFIPEVNQMQGFPFGPHQPNIGNHGIPMPGNTPEAFQRLMGMEIQANTKQIPHYAPSLSQGAYGHEVDFSFQYR